MKAAIVTATGKTPIYGDIDAPIAREGEELISVRAAALSNLTKSRASGAHYSSSNIFPAVAGTDGVGVTKDGRRVYFAMPEPPNGALAELCPSHTRRLVDIPDSLDNITAAAIANPGMSAWGALVERAHLVAGETVLINGATGTAGRIAVQLAKHLGASRIIATGRNAKELEEVQQLGADIIIPFALDPQHPSGAKDYEEALKQVFSSGIDVVIDYLWGQSAKTAIVAIAKTVDDAPVRFVHVGGASREENIELPGAALRASGIMLMGSGVGSLSRAALVQSIKHIFELVQPANLKIATEVAPLSKVGDLWEKATGKPRLVFTID
jgi:NADPH:quinone reductase-like Zn-dependent oxidoreductase